MLSSRSIRFGRMSRLLADFDGFLRLRLIPVSFTPIRTQIRLKGTREGGRETKLQKAEVITTLCLGNLVLLHAKPHPNR
ncbi:hypothetical protein GUJ93_ZPchr0006g41868 [Zizania palustris]|uniref:Uncharacterized protein n=1 Tax=Zizania palustris TaxID=103762 RepID=A0A8J5VTK3_ZIZPA|nr:hypothetical protein GUJ93_ZPchr0006g41868 [Zizania palustris]KAG8071266.1 hypothetical protein GUJ93_ZPchr0006g41868 [Zizania palustris]